MSQVAKQPPTELPARFGRYKLLKLLGKGGMGSVYLAHDARLDRQVALKIPLLEGDGGSQVLARFLREARAAAALHHPNICPTHDVGEIDGLPYLTMAFIDGKPLREFAKQRPLTPRQSAVLVRKIALALQEAHRQGILHRDLKPANIMIDKRGEPVIMDFGLARRTRQGDPRITHEGVAMGTPAYMSPEQCSGNVDAMGPTCDIYSLGVILYELLAGRLPFTGDMMAMLSQVLLDEAPPPSRFRPDLDPEIEAICLKAMAKQIDKRYPSMALLAAALLDYVRGNAGLSEAAPPSSRTMGRNMETPRPVQTQKQGDIGGTARTGDQRSPAPLMAELYTPREKRGKRRRGKRSRSREKLPWLIAAGCVTLVVILLMVIIFPPNPKLPPPEPDETRPPPAKKPAPAPVKQAPEGRDEDKESQAKEASGTQPAAPEPKPATNRDEARASATQSSPTALAPNVSALLESGNRLVRQRLWKEAAELYDQAIKTGRVNSHVYSQAAVLPLVAGDRASYQRICALMLGRFRNSNLNYDLERTVKTCLIAGDVLEKREDLATLARLAQERGAAEGYLPFYQFARGLAEYRMGQYAAAIAAFEQSRNRTGIKGERTLDILNLLFEGMAKHHLGRKADGRQLVMVATRLLNSGLDGGLQGSIGGGWHDWLFCQLASKEAADAVRR